MNKNKKYKEWKEFLKDDEDYDWQFIIRVLSYKLKRTRTEIHKHKRFIGFSKVCTEIKEVEILLNRVNKDNYFNNELKDFEKKYGKVKNKFIQQEDGSYRSETNWDKIPKEKRGPAKRVYKNLLKKADKKSEEDLNKAFSLLSKNIRKWWD